MQQLQVEYIDIQDLIAYKRNARTHSDEQVEQVANSIQEFGFTNPVLVDEHNELIAGHGRTEAAKRLGMKEVPAIRLIGLSEAQKKALRIADNQLALNAGWDEDLLKIELADLQVENFDLDLLGFSLNELDDLLVEDSNSEAGSEVVEDEIPEAPEEPKTKTGDVWILGKHRLMCGDSTKLDAVEKLMNGEKADIAFTSPPYNASKTPSELTAKKTSKYLNDDDNKSAEEYCQFLCDFTVNSLAFSNYSFVNIQSLANNKLALIDYLYSLKNNYADTIIWDKVHGQPAMGSNILNSVFEYVHIFSHKANRVVGAKQFRGTLNNVIHIKQQSKNEFSHIHNATFPIEFAEHFVKNFSEKSVLDLFSGTGTTLIVCEKLRRKCYGMELDPRYCDVIIKRWQEMSGGEAVRSDGVKFNDL